MKFRNVLLLAAGGVAIAVAQPPQAEISNSAIQAKLYLPDAQSGYYRGTRFDWSGVIASLKWNGHDYFGQWFDHYDPKLHDAISGPVEEFQTNDAGLGYEDAKPGGVFVKIGVGVIRKPDEPHFRRFETYEIVDSGKWTVHRGSDSIEFVHELGDTGGYAYLYRKTVRLSGDKLVLEHHLRNTGHKAITTSVYDHNFFMLDHKPSGPGLTVRFPFEPHATKDFNGFAELRGKEFGYLRELQPGQTVITDIEGFGSTARDYDIHVENRNTGAGVRQTSDHPISKIVLWSIRSNVSPEAYINLEIAPGKEASWRIAYEFYEVQKVNPAKQ